MRVQVAQIGIVNDPVHRDELPPRVAPWWHGHVKPFAIGLRQINQIRLLLVFRLLNDLLVISTRIPFVTVSYTAVIKLVSEFRIFRDSGILGLPTKIHPLLTTAL